MIPFEEDNLKAYRLLLRIEIAIRECLRNTLEVSHGSKWRKMLPGELLKKIRDAQAEEKRPQFDYICLGPLYYLSLGELVVILQQKPGASMAALFGGDGFIKQLESILGLRNAICHARRVPSVGLKALEALYLQIETALTHERLIEILSSPDVGMSQHEAAKVLIPWMEEAKGIISNLQHPIPVTGPHAIAAQQYWWGKTELAGFDCMVADRAVDVIADYNALHNGIGSAANRNRFCEDRRPLEAINDAIQELRKVS
jgi:hypothetical protein